MEVSGEVVSCEAAGANCAGSWNPVEPTQHFGLYPKGMRSLRRVLSRRVSNSDQHFKIMAKTIDRIVDGKTPLLREGDRVGGSLWRELAALPVEIDLVKRY